MKTVLYQNAEWIITMDEERRRRGNDIAGEDDRRRTVAGELLARRLLAARAFAAPEGKAALDAITHPEIVRRIRLAKHAAEEAGASLYVLDGAVIVGTEAEAECDRLAVVTAPFETSVARIAKRDGIAPEMAARRLNAQTPEEALLARADYVLRIDADLAALDAAANALCEQLLAEGGTKGGARPSI